jgi:hypothetical protein
MPRMGFEPMVQVGKPVSNGEYFWFICRPVKSDIKLHELNGNYLTWALRERNDLSEEDLF